MLKNRTRSAVLASILLSFAFLLPGSPCTDWRWANPQPQGNRLAGIVYGAGRFVAVGDGGVVLVSSDGETWFVRPVGTKQDLSDVAWSGSRFVAVGASGTILSSGDGLTWTLRSTTRARTRHCAGSSGRAHSSWRSEIRERS